MPDRQRLFDAFTKARHIAIDGGTHEDAINAISALFDLVEHDRVECVATHRATPTPDGERRYLLSEEEVAAMLWAEDCGGICAKSLPGIVSQFQRIGDDEQRGWLSVARRLLADREVR